MTQPSHAVYRAHGEVMPARTYSATALPHARCGFNIAVSEAERKRAAKSWLPPVAKRSSRFIQRHPRELEVLEAEGRHNKKWRQKTKQYFKIKQRRLSVFVFRFLLSGYTSNYIRVQFTGVAFDRQGGRVRLLEPSSDGARAKWVGRTIPRKP